MIAGTATCGSRLPTCPRHMAATRARPVSGIIGCCSVDRRRTRRGTCRPSCAAADPLSHSGSSLQAPASKLSKYQVNTYRSRARAREARTWPPKLSRGAARSLSPKASPVTLRPRAAGRRRDWFAIPRGPGTTLRPKRSSSWDGEWMKLEQEVRHKSEDVDEAVLLDVIKAVRRRVRLVRRTNDSPYVAGYSVDGHTVYIDRHVPRSFRWLMKTVRVDQFLLMHEIVEKALLDELRLHYIHAHQIAVRASA